MGMLSFVLILPLRQGSLMVLGGYMRLFGGIWTVQCPLCLYQALLGIFPHVEGSLLFQVCLRGTPCCWQVSGRPQVGF
ncbi:hypothetical protein EDC04DRAFT_441533 [Pisolithus marmoratus]|nr:hypothetical protein EDC04DRAFT_441533 [Pisolithus marmoratus]